MKRFLLVLLILSGNVPEQVKIENNKIISNSENLKIEVVDSTIIIKAL